MSGADRLAGLSAAEKARLLELLREKKQGAGRSTLARRDPALDPPPLSFAQQRLWFLDRLRPDDAAYNIPSSLAAEGPLDVPALHRALHGVVARHEALRTTFALRGEEPVQVIAPWLTVALPVVDLSGLGDRGDAEATRLRCAAELEPFDLAAGPLLRARLLHLAPGKAPGKTPRHLLVMVLHHIVSDGWSGSLLIQELTTLYGGGTPPPLPIQYADFAVWQRRELSGAGLDARLATWRARLAGAPPVLDLPSDRPRGVGRTTRGGSIEFRLEPPVAGRLQELARERKATPFVVLLAAFQAWLHRLTGRDDLCVGAPVANRGRPEIASLIGFFVNTLVLRGDLAGDPSFAALVERLRPVAFEAFEHQEVPFEKLVEELRPERETGRPPLVQVALTLQNYPAPAGEVGGLRVEIPDGIPPVSKLDLSLILQEHAGGLGGALLYSADLFDRPTVERFVAALLTLTSAACADPATRLSDLPLLGAGEQAQVRTEWNDTAVAPADPACIPERFARRAASQAARHPERLALVTAEAAWTWGELAGRVAALARHLRSCGVGPEVRVAAPAPRTPETIEAMLAVLTAGGTWVPLDPTLPEARRDELLHLAEALYLPHLLQEREGRGVGGEVPAWEATTAAYLLFTSGSTGAPKAVVVEHRQLRHYVDAITPHLGAAVAGTWAVVSTLAADLGHTALFPALCGGGTLHLLTPEQALDPEAFADYAERHRIDALKIVPSHLAALLAGTRPASVLPRELLVLGGEATSWELAGRIAELAPDLRVLHHYGPTETTVGAVAGPIEPSPWSPRPALGRPLANMEAHVLDRHLREVPPGVPGELVLAGAGVARGYHGRPDLTAEKFLPYPFGHRTDPSDPADPSDRSGPGGARAYRTGDLVRRLPDGRLEFLGRVDGQVKIRGFRVEPGEVEAVLAGHPQVRECAVVVDDGPNGPTLAACVVAPGVAGSAILRAWLAERLPAVLVPTGWVLLDALPLTANGKVDRQALRGRAPREVSRREATPPRTELERAIGAVWAEVLGVARVGVDDSFFDLGGHSLLLPRVQRGLRERLGREVPLLALFAHPTVAALAVWWESRDAPEAPGAEEDSRERMRRGRQGLDQQRRRLAQRRPV